VAIASMYISYLPEGIDNFPCQCINRTGTISRQAIGFVELWVLIDIKEVAGMSSTPFPGILQQAIAPNFFDIFQSFGTLLIIHFDLECLKHLSLD